MTVELTQEQMLTLTNALDKAEELIDRNDHSFESKLRRLKEVNRVITHTLCCNL